MVNDATLVTANLVDFVRTCPDWHAGVGLHSQLRHPMPPFMRYWLQRMSDPVVLNQALAATGISKLTQASVGA